MPLRPDIRLLLGFMCIAGAGAAAQADTITIGAQTGQQIFFNSTLTRTYNFGITQTGAGQGLSITTVDVNLKGGNAAANVAPVFVRVYSGLGGTGTLLASGSVAASTLTSQFNFITVPLNTTVVPTTGGYSVVLTTTNVVNYYLKEGKTTITTGGTGSTLVNQSYWVEDTNIDGTAGTSLVASGTVLATWTLGTNAMAFGNYRVGATLSSTTPIVNTALVTSNTVTQALAVTSTTTGGISSLTGLPSPFLSVGGTSDVVATLNGATTGPNSGTATLAFSSVPGTSNTTGTTAIGSGTIAISGTGWNWANAKVSSGTYAFGNVRTGSAATNQSFAVGNQAVALAAYQDLLDVSGSTSNGQVSVTGFQNLASSTNGTATSTVTLAANTATAGTLASTVALSYMSDANGVVGLTNGTATFVGGEAPTLATTGGVYDYANAVYTGTAFAFGYLHRGAPAVSGSVAIGNETVTNASFQDSLNASASTGNPLVSASGFTGLGASGGGSSTGDLVVAATTGTAGSLVSTLALSLVSNANGVAGLSNGVATVVGTPGAITTSGTVYTGQSTWITNGGGQWGTLSSDFGTNWNWATFDGSPGLDAGFTDTDTATFGNAVTGGTATVTITATPSVRSVTFNNSAASYLISAASGGSLALRNGGTNAATVSVAAGAHAIAAAVALESSATIDVVIGSLLSASGIWSGGNGILKTGSGELALTDISSFMGPTDVAAGLLRVNGSIAASSLTTVEAGATLSGTGVVGPTLVYGVHAPGNSPGIQTTGTLTYQGGASVQWELVANSISGRGTNYDGIDVTGPLTFAGPTTLDLSFSGTGSSVDWTDVFWATDHVGTDGWLIFSGADSLTGFANLTISGTNWADFQGDMLNTDRPNGTFTTYQSGNDVYLNYVVSVPEPDTLILAGLGLGLAAFAARQRSRHGSGGPDGRSGA